MVGLSGALIAGDWRLRRIGGSTAVFTSAIALASLCQAVVPQLLNAARRDAALIEAGQWWRIATAVFVQDGGVTGTLFNLVSLLLIGTVAEALWGSWLWTLFVVGGGMVGELVALHWQPIGAGNSVCTFSLAGSICAVTLTRPSNLAARISRVAALGAYAALLAERDIHGLPALFGVAIGFLLRNSARPAASS